MRTSYGRQGEVTVKLTDKREFKAKVIGADPRTDVALLKIDAKDLPTVHIGDPNQVKVGQWVAAIGSPFGFENSISAGIVSAKGRALPDETYVPFIQTDMAVNPGNSGGPLFDLNGDVIGINSQIYSRTGGYMGLSFAIPIDIAMDVASQLQRSGQGDARPYRRADPGAVCGPGEVLRTGAAQRSAGVVGGERRPGGQGRLQDR